jgi:predicted transposase/invertase (TIGR01784 family)
MKTDKLFYRIFLSQPALISELLPGIPPDCEFDYSAPVVKETEVRLDGLLTPVSDDLSLPLVFLEAQMQSDPDFYGRFFVGLFLYLRQYAVIRPWRGLLILRRRSQDLGVEVPYQLQLENQVQRVYLEDLLPVTGLSPNLALLRLLVVPPQEAGVAARSLLNDVASETEFQRRLDLVEAILANKFPQLSVTEVRQMLDLKEANLRQTRFYQEILQEGLQAGRQEGLQAGRQEGESSIVMRLLDRQCGALSVEQQDQVRSLSIAQLEALSEALLDFTAIADLDAWLRENIA